jgi:hypothetical protein
VFCCPAFTSIEAAICSSDHSSHSSILAGTPVEPLGERPRVRRWKARDNTGDDARSLSVAHGSFFVVGVVRVSSALTRRMRSSNSEILSAAAPFQAAWTARRLWIQFGGLAPSIGALARAT